FGRFRVRPEGGNEYLDGGAAAAKPANFLVDEIAQRVSQRPARLQIVVQLAASGTGKSFSIPFRESMESIPRAIHCSKRARPSI
ncbi:MAG: hypothetical protein ACRD5Z_09670, partial [Bryobacteraceae bacterium]